MPLESARLQAVDIGLDWHTDIDKAAEEDSQLEVLDTALGLEADRTLDNQVDRVADTDPVDNAENKLDAADTIVVVVAVAAVEKEEESSASVDLFLVAVLEMKLEERSYFQMAALH